MRSGLLPTLLDLLLPPRCAACDEPAWEAGRVPLCAGCRRRLPLPAARCAACGRITGPLGPVPTCARCSGPGAETDALRWSGEPSRLRRRPLRGVLACWPYEGAARDLIRATKFRQRPEVARLLGPLLAEVVEAARTPGDLVVPVPLSGRGWRRRGYNQAAVLAAALAERLGVRYRAAALQRTRHDTPQSGRSRQARLRGPQGAFLARPRLVRGRCVLLVDDVLTTGATAVACARALRRAGASAVTAAVVCRTERR